MSESAPNLFNALFDFRPRENHTAKENFLSEGFAYVLKTSKLARDAWISRVLKRRVETRRTEIFTRNSERLGDTVVFPDMLIQAELSDGNGKCEIIYAEHKWDAKCEPGQLQKYFDVAKGRSGDALVIFIGSRQDQLRAAKNTRLGPEQQKLNGCFLWEDVFTTLQAVPQKDEVFSQFLAFMKTHGLNPGEPLSPTGLVALLEASKAKLGIHRAIERLSEMDWGIVPVRYRAKPEIVYEKWGCTNLILAAPAWRPTVTIGFLLDTVDHAVALTNPAKGIDLMLRIAAPPDSLRPERIQPALAVLGQKLPELEKVASSARLVRQKGNGNPWSLLMMQSCLADVIAGAKGESESAQHEEIYRVLTEWLKILFGDGALEAALLASGLKGLELPQSPTSSPPACANPTPAPAGE